MKHEEYKQMIPAHALSALDPADDRMLTNHLVECSECRGEFDEWQETAAALALGSDVMEPSPQLRERILVEVRALKTSKPVSNVVPFAPAQKNVWTSFGSLGAI